MDQIVPGAEDVGLRRGGVTTPPVVIADFAAFNRTEKLPPRPLVKSDFERMRIPEEYWFVRVEKVIESSRAVVLRYLVHLRNYFDLQIPSSEKPEFCYSLYVHGEVGVGKTSIAVLAAKEARLAGLSVYFLSCFEFREAIRNKTVFEEDVTVLDRCRDVGLLILDAFNDSDLKDPYVGPKFFEELLTYRRSRNKPTILTSRISFDDGDGMYANALIHKSADLYTCLLGRFHPVAVEGPNRRFGGTHQMNKVLGK